MRNLRQTLHFLTPSFSLQRPAASHLRHFLTTHQPSPPPPQSGHEHLPSPLPSCPSPPPTPRTKSRPTTPPTAMATGGRRSPEPAAQPPSIPTKPTSYYMRELPENIVKYDSSEGKALFKAALNEGGMEAFFPLSQQFLTQNEPAFCGLGTLCMILNAFKIDPASTWRKPWRWFTQEMLDCCRPLEYVKQNGITLAEFTCLAKCNGLEATTRYANLTSFEEFEQAVKDCTHSVDQVMAVSYSRASLGQTGSGHFSPAGGYTSLNGGMVLILDVARFKYPSYWVPIRALYEALLPPDNTSGQPRGYCILRRPPAETPNPALLTLNATTPVWPALYEPLANVATTAASYDSLISSLSAILSSPTGLPIVTSRYESVPLSNLAVTLPHSPSFDASAGVETHSAYRRGVARLKRYFAENSRLYQQLNTDDLWKTEITVFVLALLSSRDIKERMSTKVKEEVEEKLTEELADDTIRSEVIAVRRQLEGLTDCSQTQGTCSKPAGTCCGRNCR
ncbi:Phytochelatin synthase-domain-containing protein [Sphaerosporella brunnea]|uniref:glutathione gamma-glutamylcysteinyltransferase n=1 Tax=Sphaerosporella brunnea TaxID=1250544 RepID=A0A5J5EWN6_9PEZI|nr:Phytochelatin synthase-domain-containing protein [Sphaerosporella brunnea]